MGDGLMVVPVVLHGADVKEPWGDAVAAAIAEAQALTVWSGPAAVDLHVSWPNYGTVHSDAQVVRFGPLVIMIGIIRNSTGAAAGPAITGIGTIPTGFRPRAVGAVAPLGGSIMVGNAASVNARIDIGVGGGFNIGYTTGAATIPSNGWVALQAAWVGE